MWWFDKGPLAPLAGIVFGFTFLVLHRVFAVVRGDQPGLSVFEFAVADPVLLTGLVQVIRETELAGGRVARVLSHGPRQSGVLAAVDLTLRLRALSPGLSEQELLAVLELLPL